MEYFNFVTDEALISNLERLLSEHSVLIDQRTLELSDIARLIADATAPLLLDGLGVYEAFSLASDALAFGEYRASDITTDENAKAVSSALDVQKRLDKAVFADLYVEELKSRGVFLAETDFLCEGNGDDTFVYVRNAFSDEAFDVFSQEFDDPRLKYSASFKECADMVSDDEVTYCLLPLEERGGVRLPTVSEIIFRRDFKINSVTPVFGPDGNADMKYAMVSKNFTVPAIEDGDDRYLELRVCVAPELSLSEILTAIDHFSMSVYRVNTVVFDTEGESETYYSLVIRDGGNDFTHLLTYLALFAGDFVPVGIYKNLE